MARCQNGAAGWNRTSDPWLRRPILYPLSYSRTGKRIVSSETHFEHTLSTVEHTDRDLEKSHGNNQSIQRQMEMSGSEGGISDPD